MVSGDGKIDRLNTLVELVRFTASTGRGITAAKSPSLQAPQHEGQAAPAPRHNIAELRRRLGRQLRERRMAPEQTPRLIVREILLWEFGSQLEQHSEFNAMLAAIEKAFDANPNLKAKMAALAEEVRSQSQE